MNYKSLITYLIALAITLFLLFLPEIFFKETITEDDQSLAIMTYSSFLQKWGAGPEIAELFKKETGLTIRWINAGNAGLILERLKFKRHIDKPDLVIGFDQFSIHEARKVFQWQDIREFNNQVKDSILPKGSKYHDFLAYDWGPMTFVYREGVDIIPESLDDLLKPEFKNRLILQDPRMSSPGLQFLLWVLAVKGEKKGFEYLTQLKKSIKIMPPSWSSSYSLFRMSDETFVFSYFSSPFYHQVEEGDDGYKAVVFNEPHPIQVEYAAIPSFCQRCDQARLFARFLMKEEVQKILMNKNYMFPVSKKVLHDSDFIGPDNVKYLDPIESLRLINKKKELVNQWKTVFY